MIKEKGDGSEFSIVTRTIPVFKTAELSTIQVSLPGVIYII